jgi:exosortase N
MGMAIQNMVTKENLQNHWFPLLTTIICLAILAIWCFGGYLVMDAGISGGLMLAPCIVLVRHATPKLSLRFGLLSLLFLTLSMLIPTRTFHFFILAFTLFFILENWWGRLNDLPIFLVIVMSSMVKNCITVFGFPIRLTLSRYAANLLSMFGMNAQPEGNVIWLNGQEYSVDPACMGLSMVQISLLFGLAIVAIFERKKQKTLSFAWILILFALIIGLNIFYNLLRILLLVLLNWMPGTVMHDIGGLVGLVVYVFIPTWFLVDRLYRKYGKNHLAFTTIKTSKKGYSIFAKWLTSLLCIGLFWIAISETKRTIFTPQTEYPHLDLNLPLGVFKENKLAHGVVQYASDTVLIYVKPIRGFYSSEHTPLICWEGSGYKFSATNEKTLPNGQKYYAGLLKKDQETLHTAWWYSNGITQTTSQWKWRWLDLQGERSFFLVNVSAVEEGEIERFLKK